VLLLSPRQPLACDSPTALWDWVTLQGDTLTGQGCDSAEAIARQPATVLVWPAQALSWLQLSLPKAPAHKLRALLDGLLEERLLSDLADLHYALAPGFRPGRAADTWVLCCQREPLQRAVDYLQAIAHPLAAVLPACAPQPALQARPWVWVSGSSEAPALLASAAHGALWLPLQPHASAADRAHYRMLAGEIERFGRRSYEPSALPEAPGMPPGAPIGQAALDWLGAWGWYAAPELAGASGAELTCNWR